jgi:catecholate siderophore receptor
MKDVPNVPNSAFNLWLTYETPGDWTLGTGLNFVGHRYADMHNTAGVPAFVVFNEMLAYRVDRNLSVQINLNNLTNRLYYSSLYYSAVDENHAVPGPGRTLVLSASLRYD